MKKRLLIVIIATLIVALIPYHLGKVFINICMKDHTPIDGIMDYVVLYFAGFLILTLLFMALTGIREIINYVKSGE